MSWIELPAGKYQQVEASQTLSHNQTEVMIQYVATILSAYVLMHPGRHENLVFYALGGEWNKSAPLKILSFDIETNVPVDNSFVRFHATADLPVIQIGNIMEETRGTNVAS
jgi:hypothetical protein